MKRLEELGVTATQTFRTDTTTIQGIEVSGKETTDFVITLPVDCGIEATFSHEGLGRKLAKLFRKELQTGDASFDDDVFITTDTPETTAKLLTNLAVREAIAEMVTLAGPIEISGAKVELQLSGHATELDIAVVDLVRALLGK